MNFQDKSYANFRCFAIYVQAKLITYYRRSGEIQSLGLFPACPDLVSIQFPTGQKVGDRSTCQILDCIPSHFRIGLDKSEFQP